MQTQRVSAIVIGAGPAGLMAAEQLANAGIEVDVFEAMPSVARKFLRAGIGGLNITHSDECDTFRSRYGNQAETVGHWLSEFDAQALRDWCAELGVETFVGSSGRVFPLEKKAAPLLRRWLHRLRESGVRVHVRHRWLDWDEQGDLRIEGPTGVVIWQAPITVFALGGGSWRKLGSDGAWLAPFTQQGIACLPFRPANCGFEYPWPDAMMTSQAGAALKNISLALNLADGREWSRKGDAIISTYGLEGSLIYAASQMLREQLEQNGVAEIFWDLLPDRSEAQLRALWQKRKPKMSLSTALQKCWGLKGSKLALLKALSSREQMEDQIALASLVKRLPQRLLSTRPLDEAISTAGGVSLASLNQGLMLENRPGSFCAGEMLDWEAPTGGYLLTACFASGAIAGRRAAEYYRSLTT